MITTKATIEPAKPEIKASIDLLNFEGYSMSNKEIIVNVKNANWKAANVSLNPPFANVVRKEIETTTMTGSFKFPLVIKE
ncbi:MAG: hypothetical protein OHK003_02190 [Anaerolineales bacterium]